MKKYIKRNSTWITADQGKNWYEEMITDRQLLVLKKRWLRNKKITQKLIEKCREKNINGL